MIRGSGLFSDTLILKHLKQTHYPIFRLRDLFIEEDTRVEVVGSQEIFFQKGLPHFLN